MNVPRHDGSCVPEAADLESRAVDGRVHDAQRRRWLEAEASVVGGVAEKCEQPPALTIGAVDQLGHERTPEAASLPIGMDRERRHSGDSAAVEAGVTDQHMTDDHVLSGGDQLEVRERGAKATHVVDDSHLVVPASERFAHDVQDPVVICHRCRPHAHRLCSGCRS